MGESQPVAAARFERPLGAASVEVADVAKQAREQRRNTQRARLAAGPAAAVADRAERGIAELLDGIGRYAAVRGLRIKQFDIAGFGSLRESSIERGYRWPTWCYLPCALVGVGLGEELAIDVNGSHVSPATMLASLAAAWAPGRIAVRFDDDVAKALMDTPVLGTIPIEVLQRLPAWGLYVDCPAFGPGAGFFVTLDAGTVFVPGDKRYTEVDELLFAVVRSGGNRPPVVMSSLWLRPGATIGESIAQQAQEAERLDPTLLESPEDEWAAAIGMSRAEATARLLSLVLYLCSEDTDLTRRSVPLANPSPRAMGEQAVVMSAGFRLGTALRTAAADYARNGGDGTGPRVAPHLRRAHWHHFWAGSESRQDRHLRLRWVSPIRVNAGLSEELLTVVRPAGDPIRPRH